MIAVITPADADDWAAMRHALWQEEGLASLRAEIDEIFASPQQLLNMIARNSDGEPTGFAEASLRHDYVNGCETSPVVFLEGIYVTPAFRRTGIARQLVAEVESWGRQQGCTELASDADIDNGQSHQMHAQLGFTETERVVYFRKPLVQS